MASRLVYALTMLASALLSPAANTQELNAWDQRGAAQPGIHGEPKTRAEVIAELADARQAGWRINSAEVSWFAEPALVAQLAQRSQERVARRVQAERLVAAHKRQLERVATAPPRQRRPAITLPAVATAPVYTAATARPSPVIPATALAIRSEPVWPAVLPLAPEPLRATELPPLMVREDRLDFRLVDDGEAGVASRTELPAIEPPAAPAAAETRSTSRSAEQV